jgi:glycerol-3-phosphate dehydrogenase
MALETFNKRSRTRLFDRLTAETFDLLVIGGGVTGASIFRDAALRGMSVALLEALDFASGTSSRSSKLIHGGLRYLKNLGFRMAWESCHERNLHVRLNKRLVHPEPFLVPIYKGRSQSAAMLRLGMILYECLSGFQNFRCHRFLTREEALLLAPGLPSEGLMGGCIYYDAVVNDSRWTIEIIKDGVRQGGVALNYAPVVALHKDQGCVVGAATEDSAGPERKAVEVRARAIVNATGIFADSIRRMDEPTCRPLMRLSKGTHLVFADTDVPLSVTTVFSSSLDGRPLFLVKHEGCFLYGTTDDWELGEPGSPRPGTKDCEYLLASLRSFMPEAALDARKVQLVYSGFRPLLAPDADAKDIAADPTRVSREDFIEVAPSQLISVIGGKLTTARLMALRVLKKVIARIGRRRHWKKSVTHLRSLGGTNEAVAEGLAYWVKQENSLASYFRTLYQRYGLDAHGICAEALRIHRGQLGVHFCAWPASGA